jgi:hypothetical protein
MVTSTTHPYDCSGSAYESVGDFAPWLSVRSRAIEDCLRETSMS